MALVPSASVSETRCAIAFATNAGSPVPRGDDLDRLVGELRAGRRFVLVGDRFMTAAVRTVFPRAPVIVHAGLLTPRLAPIASRTSTPPKCERCDLERELDQRVEEGLLGAEDDRLDLEGREDPSHSVNGACRVRWRCIGCDHVFAGVELDAMSWRCSCPRAGIGFAAAVIGELQ